MDRDYALRALRAMLLLTLGLPGCVGGEKTTSACDGSTPILDAAGAATGYERCEDGSIHRVSAVATSSAIEGESCLGTEEYLGCTTDADCEAYGSPGSVARCLHQDYIEIGGRTNPDAYPDSGMSAQDGCTCAFSCATDADCGDGYACVPADIVTTDKTWASCEPATCTTDADCAGGECGIASYNNGCGYETTQACRETSDTCRSDADCTDGAGCGVGYEEETFACQEMNCAIGRPLTVDGEARVAQAAARADWSADLDLDLDGVEPALRHSLAAWWREVAALEHASVGSFARFTLELLALGAPPDLLAATQRAAADEIEHARLTFALAGAYGGAPVGPGPLSLARVEIGADAATILRDLITEACVGETLGAAEARESAAQAADPALSTLLTRIAADEERHAALAWRALRWMLERDPTLIPLARETFAEAAQAARARPLYATPDAPIHGVLGPRSRRDLHLATLAQVVEPCAAALLGAEPAVA